MNQTSAAKYLQGSTLRHVVNTTMAGTLGLMAIFVIDLLDMYFISLLGEQQLAAAIGFASTIIFFTSSIGIGMGICIGALIARALGKGELQNARNIGMDTAVIAFLLSIIVVAILLPNLKTILGWLGATEENLTYSLQYLNIIIPSMPLIVMAMSFAASLRGIGDAKHAMTITLLAGLTNAILDPIFIFSLDMGIQGAAWASVCARLVACGVGMYHLVSRHKFYAPLSWRRFKTNSIMIMRFAFPAVITNVTVPIGNAYVVSAMAAFSGGAVAGMAIVGRVTPVAFGVIFALSGAIGPIIGQNFGAQNIDRVKKTIKDAMLFVIVVVITISLILFFAQEGIILAFKASPQAADLIRFFCTFMAILFVSNGFNFVSNAAFNNLGKPKYAAWFNFARATLGTIPFVYLGAIIWGPKGVLMGQALGGVIVTIVSLMVLKKWLNRCESGEAITSKQSERLTRRIPSWPQSNQQL